MQASKQASSSSTTCQTGHPAHVSDPTRPSSAGRDARAQAALVRFSVPRPRVSTDRKRSDLLMRRAHQQQHARLWAVHVSDTA